MKKLIKKILKESVDNRIIDVLVKLKLTHYNEIYDFLRGAGYDRNEIKEIYSIYFESISGVELTPYNWMDYHYSPDQLEVIETDYRVDNDASIYYKKNGITIMQDDLSIDFFWFDFMKIWSPLEDIFDLDYDGVHKVLRKWLTKNIGKGWHSIDQTELS